MTCSIVCFSSKESASSAGDLDSIPELGRPPEEGNGYLVQYSCLENSMDRGAWRAPVHGVTESDMTKQLTFTHTHTLCRKAENWELNLSRSHLKPVFLHPMLPLYGFNANSHPIFYFCNWPALYNLHSNSLFTHFPNTRTPYAQTDDKDFP